MKKQKSEKSISNKTDIGEKVSDSVIVSGNGNVINVGTKKTSSTSSKKRSQPRKKKGNNTAIIIAIIGLVGVVLAAFIGIIPNILKNNNNAPISDILPTNSLVAPTPTFTALPTIGFWGECIDSEIWTPYVGEELSSGLLAK